MALPNDNKHSGLIKVGNSELREPDYRQVLRWAKALCREPEDVLAVLSKSFDEFGDENSRKPHIEGGHSRN